MTTLTHNTPDELSENAAKKKVFLGLLWRQWVLYKNTLLWFLSVWLIGLWILPLFNHPAWIAVFGLVYAFLLAPSMGGADAAEGSEEFAFALPTSRGEQYLARMTMGLVPLVLLCFVGLVAIKVQAPQIVWGWVVETGFTEPNVQSQQPRAAYANSLLLPLALFGALFCLSAMGLVTNMASMLAILLTGLVYNAAYWAEQRYSHSPDGDYVVAGLAVQALGTLLGGYYLYTHKEGMSKPSNGIRSNSPLAVIGWIVLFLMVLILMSSLA